MHVDVEERRWVLFQGEKVLGRALIIALDSERSTVWSLSRSDRTSNRYNHMIYPLQKAIDAYTKGEDEIDEYLLKDFKECYRHVPENLHLPDCIEELYTTLEQELGITVPSVLVKAKQVTKNILQRENEEKEKQDAKHASTQAILESIQLRALPMDGKDPIAEIDFLCKMIKAKKETPSYTLSEEEADAFDIWVSLLCRVLHNDLITYGQMKVLEREKYVKSFDFSDMLENLKDERDYEWYEEGFMGQSINAETVFKVEDVLKIALPKFKQILGLE